MENLNQKEKIIWSCWEEKSPREVVREAAAKGTHITLAIKFLMENNGWNESTAKDWFNAEVSAWIVQLLIRKQIFKAVHILNKVQINVEDHLMSIARESAQISFRDFIVEHLEKISKDFPEDKQSKFKQNFYTHWKLLLCLEKSFEKEGTFKQNRVFGLGKDRIIVNETEIKALTIEKIEQYPDKWKSKIATCLFFDTFEFSLLTFSTPLQVWDSLLENNKAMILVHWINIQMSEVVRDMNTRFNFFNNENFVQKLLTVDAKGLNKEVLEKLDGLFRKWTITKDMIERIGESTCFNYTKMCIYDTLSSYGIVKDNEKSNLYDLISRLARTQSIKLVDNVFTEPCATLSKHDFYIELAKYCVKHKLYQVLTVCVEGEDLGSHLSDIQAEVKEVIELWLLFKSIEQTSDRQSHVIPVYKTCEQIAKDDINQYISDHPELVLGMILLDDNSKLFDIFSKKESFNFKDFQLPKQSYKENLPHLYNVYKNYCDVSKLTDVRDINVYQLLTGYKGLDISKIFEFQLINQHYKNALLDKPDRRSLGSLLSEDINQSDVRTLAHNPMEIPHFANTKLMKRYGYIAKLNHIYYLKQFRPCNASQALITQQYRMYNRLQEKGIHNACGEAHAVALENWNDDAMTACTIAFAAMIGCNPVRCRVHITAAKMMKEFMVNVKGVPRDTAVKVVNEYISKLAQNNDTGPQEILQYLEEITLNNVKKILLNDYVEMYEVLHQCQTMIKFAMLHNLALPEQILKTFVKRNMWYNFLLFGDVFRYPLPQMLELSQEFENISLAEHLKHVLLHRNVEDITDKEYKSLNTNGQRKYSRLGSVEISPTYGGSFEFPDMGGYARDLWEVAAACHGPEDPPGALVRAAGQHGEPLLALIATCYEPNAVGVLWAYWILATLGDTVPQSVRDTLQWDISQQHTNNDQFQKVAELCLRVGYIRTLHESIIVFLPESPLATLTQFLCRCIWQRMFGTDATKILVSFIQSVQRKFNKDNTQYALPRHVLQNISVSLVNIALSDCFDSAQHQGEFLKCLVDAQFGKEFSVPCPDYCTLYQIFQIAMETPEMIHMSNLISDDRNDYLSQCIKTYTANRDYSVALNIAKLSGLCVNDILISEWRYKHEQLMMREDSSLNDSDTTMFIAEASEAFKKACVTFTDAVTFLSSYINDITEPLQKFYSYRIVLSWYEEQLEFGPNRESMEHLMWAAYFQCEDSKLSLNSSQVTLHYILNGQKDWNASKEIATDHCDKPLSMLLSEIEIESDVANVENIVLLEEQTAIKLWRKTVNLLLELKLTVEAFRLATLFKIPTEFRCCPPACPVQIIRTCLKLAEGTCSPYELPQELRLVISSPYTRNTLSTSETSDVSFEELVVITEKQDCSVESGTHLAVREDADRLSALEALAARSGLAIIKQVANYYRISLQIGWNYVAVLKYQNDPMEFVNYVSGKARMSLANLVFRTFNIPSKQIAEYLCNEMVAAIISPHLLKTSTFRQKEHFQYTLWGYPLNSDIEMFLNMRPEACTHIGRLMLDNLMAFRKIYKCNMSMKVNEFLDDSNLDVDTLIDEEYQNVGQEEVESLTTTEGGTLVSADTESAYSVSTMYSFGPKQSKETRRNLFDDISKGNIHISYEIKSNIRRITRGSKLSTKQVNIISIELLVVAHECFSCACDTEGVAVVLRSAQALTSQLLAARSWRLMVRLVTGLARYTEMAYVFQALRDHHQFEFLLGQFDYMLGQQQEKITEFKQGLLDFLKHHCPGDTDTYILVALHFNMYAEAAHVKRKQVMDLIESLEKMALDVAKSASKQRKPPEWVQIHDNSSTRSLLETALNHCTDASELYLEGGCMGFASEMANMAQQIALQISLLNASPTRLILNRTNEQIYALVSEYLSFMEGLVLLASRQSQWRELSYRRALTNDQAYLRDMATYRPDVAHDILLRYKTEKKTTAMSQAAITELKNLCR